MSSLDSKRVRSWSGIRLPVFLYHGEVDTIVPFSHVDLYAGDFRATIIRSTTTSAGLPMTFAGCAPEVDL
jgi:hypothetical protein